MNDQETKVMELLEDGREWYGRELVQASERVLVPGIVYGILYALEKRGLVVSRLGPHGKTGPRLYRKAMWVASEAVAKPEVVT